MVFDSFSTYLLYRQVFGIFSLITAIPFGWVSRAKKACNGRMWTLWLVICYLIAKSDL